jgi:tetratricopeptide (TPR) repeat protein
MGTVWRAEGADAAVVALKVVHEHVAATPGFLERFVREGEVGRSVRHENVVATLAAGEDAGRHWIALEYVEGQTLRGLADEMGTVPEELCRHVGREVAKGLGALHAAGLVHRDVKPENVLITRAHVVKVMDLGIARGADDEQRMTATGMFVGSVQYAAPEQFTGGGKGLDARADLHALGVTLYELATGVQPFEGGDVSETLRNVLTVAPRRAGEVNPQLSAFFEEVLRTLLEKEREKRFASSADLLDALTAGEDSAWWQERAKAIRAATRKPLRRIRIPRETALYGREAELARLRAAFERAAAGEGAVLLIEGEAGIGKSRLADEFVGSLEREGHDLNFLWGSSPPGGAATASGAFSTAWREHFGNDDSALAAALPEQPLLVPAFAALLRGDAPPQGAEPLTKDSLQTVFVRSAQTLAKERATIVLVEDLHFAPDEGRALFASLAMATPGHRILLVGTTRPGLDEKWTANLVRVGAEKLVVPRLGPADLVKLLTDSLRSEHLATDLAAQIALKSDGNPFFVFEILRGLREGLFLTRREDGTWATTKRIDEIQIPPSIAELIQARVSDLGDEDRNLLEVAACVGFEFDPGLVGAVIGLAPIPTLQRLGAIEKRTRLVRASGKRFVFDHHQAQEHLFSGISEALREQYHAAIGDALEARSGAASHDPSSLDGGLCVDICEHYLRGVRGESALRYLEPALAHLESGHRNDQAIGLADRALALPGLLAAETRFDVLLLKADRLDLLGRMDAQRAALDEVLALADASGEASRRARARVALGWHLLRVHRLAEAEAIVGEAIETARVAVDREAEVTATGTLGSVLLDLGRLAEAEAQHGRHLALTREIGDRAGEAGATVNLGNVFCSLGRFAEAQAQLESGLVLCRLTGQRRFEANATVNLGNVFFALGRHAEAQAEYERCLALFREIGDRRGEANVQGNLGNVLWSLGRYAEAQAQQERSLALSREVGDRMGEAIARFNLGDLRLGLGDLPGARRDLSASLALCREIGARSLEGAALTGLASVAAGEGDRAGALRLAGESLAIRREIGDGGGVTDSLGQLALLRREEGDPDGTRAAAEEALALARGQSRKAAVASCLALLATLPGGDAKAAEAALLEASETLTAEGAVPARFRLWEATGDRAHLAEAKSLLDDLLAKNPPEYHESMLTNVRVNREIVAACKEQGIA